MRHSIRNLLDSTVLYDILILVVYIYEGSIFINSVYIYNTMKELNVFIRSEHRSKVTDILQRNRAGISFFEVLGTGNTPSATPEVVHSYRTGRTTVPEFITRLLVMTFVSDTSAKKIVDELVNSFGEGSEPYGALFVKDVTDAYQLGTKLVGDEMLAPK
ncbi:MAG: P-II family nitrogen regulator [Nitrososphaeraceae archaeon]